MLAGGKANIFKVTCLQQQTGKASEIMTLVSNFFFSLYIVDFNINNKLENM